MDRYKKQLAWIESQEENMVSLLVEWVNINSGSYNLAGLEKMRTALKAAFTTLDVDIEEIMMQPMQVLDSQGELRETPIGMSLRIRKREKAPIQVFLGGHMDTVFPEKSPFQTAQFRDKRTLRGPGTADMKGGLVVLLTALMAFERSPWKETLGWEVLISADEELGSPSSRLLFNESAQRNQVGLIYEPSFANGAIVNARKGSLNFSVIARGKPAHAGRDFHSGINAISALASCLLDIETLGSKNRDITINLGKIRGGVAVNVVPEIAICHCNARVVESSDLTELKDSLRKTINLHNEQGKATLQLHIDSEREPKPYDEKQAPLFEAFQQCAREVNDTLSFVSSGGVCDGNNLSALGLPVIDTLGPCGQGLHTDEEEVYIDSLVPRAKLSALYLMKLAAGEIVIHRGG